MRNFLNRISRGGNCVCVSIILGYVCLKKKNPSFLLWFGQVVFREAPSGPKTFALYRRPLRTKYCGKEFCWDPPFKLRQLVLKKEAVPMILMESCKPVILCFGISAGTLHLSVTLVQRRPGYERCDEQIVMVLTLCAIVNHRSTRKNQVYFTLHILGLPE